MKKEANYGSRYMFALLSSYELTYVLFLDNNTEIDKPLNLFISPPIRKDKLLRAICFVLAMRYECILLEKQTSNEIENLRNDVLNYFEEKNNSLPKSVNIEYGSNSLQARILRAWREKPIQTVIGRGRTGFVVKLDLDDDESLALKMVNVFKHAPDAIDELENEYDVLQFLNEKNCM